MAGDDYTTSAFGQRSRKAAREEFQENSSLCLAISQDQPSATNATITQISRKIRGCTQEARARASTSWAVVCRAPSVDVAADAAAAALLPHKNVSENAEGGKEVTRG